ncbi:neural cell adhesion molecule 1-like [Toxorhynchites rutilus septentrionalis]|uniref:neural cell adhesion molecule 1-like n=1 Tax=Toxorhynchites rutilus septentrionalis TaxID=329112 RepID=UPI002479A68A|nr:neural cell adhesion molecule 1-like [Toxorhynchites rutilus septentrionalis]XP_055644330.1 neural cell adhesion molecule 1-like [Toxorhynchites rutilus septentrionalis]
MGRMKHHIAFKFNQVFHIIFINIFIAHFTLGLQQPAADKEKHVKSSELQAVEGRRISLPCPLSAPSRDKVYMVLWFKDDAGIPLYSFDVRGKPLQQARHWSAPESFGPRAHFNTDTDPATLDIQDVRRHDEGVYRCRVDFRTSQTQSFRYNLSIIILPEHPVVLNQWGQHLNTSKLGPKEEGDDIVLTCRVVGGRPQPAVKWLINSILVDEQYEHNSGDVIENRLLWPAIQRSDLNSIFTCQATNTQLAEPKESSYVLDLHLRPLSVKIINPPTPLVADRRYEIACESVGSRPNAIITWYKGKRQLRRAKEEILNNTTKSELSFVPTTEDDGKLITCRAENPNVTGLFLETSWKIEVVYPPIVALRLGSTLSADDIKDGDDVYFECHVQANPPWRKLHWLHDGIMITHNASARVIRSNQSLVLQKVNRNSSGNYSCSAINAEGETVSNQLALRVKYAPVCATEKIIIVGAFRSEALHIPCEVHADPPPRQFYWKFNNSGETLEITKERFVKNGSLSILSYTPVSDQDYGTLTCWGQNEVGLQQWPCFFQVVLAGLPSTVKNCTINNQTQSSVEVQCLAGYDGGLPQIFMLELISSRTGRVRYNITNPDDPYFVIEPLEALMHYNNLYDDFGDNNAFKAVIYAINQKGRSQGVVVKDFLFESTTTENRAVLTSNPLESLSPILFGILFTLLVLCFVIFVRFYYIKATTTSTTITNVSSDLVSNTKQHGSKQDSSGKKNTKQSPRWQHGSGAGGNGSGGGSIGPGPGGQLGIGSDGKTRDGKPDPTEDDRGDPDVIPAQYVSNDGEDSSFNSSKWPNGSYYERYPTRDMRPTELLIPPEGVAHIGGVGSIGGGSATSTPVVNQLHPNINQSGDPSASLKLGAYYSTSSGAGSGLSGGVSLGPGTTGPAIGLYGGGHHQSSSLLPNGGPGSGASASGAQQGGNPNDYDINVHTIKNMLMTTRVPESCV